MVSRLAKKFLGALSGKDSSLAKYDVFDEALFSGDDFLPDTRIAPHPHRAGGRSVSGPAAHNGTGFNSLWATPQTSFSSSSSSLSAYSVPTQERTGWTHSPRRSIPSPLLPGYSVSARPNEGSSSHQRSTGSPPRCCAEYSVTEGLNTRQTPHPQRSATAYPVESSFSFMETTGFSNPSSAPQSICAICQEDRAVDEFPKNKLTPSCSHPLPTYATSASDATYHPSCLSEVPQS